MVGKSIEALFTLTMVNDTVFLFHHECYAEPPHTPQPYYGPFSRTTQVSRGQKRTSRLYGARED